MPMENSRIIIPSFFITSLWASYKSKDSSNNPEIAIKHFDKSIELNPNLAEAYFNKGQCLKKLNKDFKQSFDKARQLDPNIDTSFKDSK